MDRPDDFRKLPSRWRTYITALENEVAAAKKQRPSEKTRVYLRDHGQAAQNFYLPSDGEVRFEAEGGAFDVSLSHGNLRPMAGQAGPLYLIVRSTDGRLVVVPEVSNVVGLRVERL